MIERLCTKTNTNGNALQVEIDHEAHTVERGYYLFRRDSDTITAKKAILTAMPTALLKAAIRKYKGAEK